MAVCSVGTTKYEADIGRLMERRLDRLGGGISPECGRGFAEASIEGGAQLAQWCEAVAELLLMDLAQFEIAYMVNGLPLTLEEKKAVLPEAICMAKRASGLEKLQGELMDYFEGNSYLSLEGYIRFRMQDYRRQWERCVYAAADEMLLNDEYTELLKVLSTFVKLRHRGRARCM